MSRAPLDLYATPIPVAVEICRRAAAVLPPPTQITEPSAGPGHFIVAARAAWPSARIHAVDIDPVHRDACLAAGADEFDADDWLTWANLREKKAGSGHALIIGNPPYLGAASHVEAALSLLGRGDHLLFLLRLAFLGSEERVEAWQRWPLRWFSVVVPRVSFIGGGTESGEYAVFCWEKGYVGRPEYAPPLLWGRAKQRAEAATKQPLLIVR